MGFCDPGTFFEQEESDSSGRSCPLGMKMPNVVAKWEAEEGQVKI